MRKKVLVYGLCLLGSICTLSAKDKKDVALYKDPKAPIEKRVNDLLSRMTLEEKVMQLNQYTLGRNNNVNNVGEEVKKVPAEIGSLIYFETNPALRNSMQKKAMEKSRLGIPIIFGYDAIHGFRTVYPISLAQACSWNPDLVEQACAVSAQEARMSGVDWTFSPMIDVARDPRWGRMAEGGGEDPYLGSEISAAMVKGYQGDDLTDKNTIMACVKHFALYGAPEAGRDYNTVDMSHLSMFNNYFPPYKAAIDAGVGSVMTSFNVVDGIPATGNKWLMTDVLRDRWGFDGFVVTDYTAISEMIAHGMGDLQQVSAMSLSAGTDMDMVADGFLTTLEKSLKEGKVTMAEIDKACRRILEAKYKLGLFDDPYKYCDASRVKKDIFTAENRAVARKIATETFVLLKNENNLLPLQRKGKIALVGPLANTKANMPGTWSVAATSDKYNSLYESMKQSLAGKAEVFYAKGSNLMYDAQREAEATMFGREMRDLRSAQELLDEALSVASQADVIVAAVGESSEMSGESSSRTNLEMPDAQRDLLTALKKTGKPIVLVYFAGRSTVMTWEQENFPAILNVWFGGSEAADAICDVVFGDVSPSGKLTTTFPKNVGQIPLYYNHLNTGRPLEAGKWFSKFRSNYLDIDNDPLYPFGYGLSYTTFRYGDLQLSNNSMNEKGKITASVTVTNTGNYDADEIVQMYIRDMVGSVARPVKELKGFERIHLKKGESRTVSFDITAEQLKFYNSTLNWACEPGEFEVMVGGNSRDVQTKKFSLQ